VEKNTGGIREMSRLLDYIY